MNSILRSLLLMIFAHCSGMAYAGNKTVDSDSSDWSETPVVVIAETVRLQQTAALLTNQGNIDQALATHEQHQQLIHQTAGVNSLLQAPVLAAMIDLHLKAGDIRSADRRARHYLRLHEHAYGKHSTDLLPALKQQALWESRSGRWSDAMFTFEDAIRIVRKTGKKQGYTPSLQAELLALNEAADIAAERMYAQDALMTGRR